RGHHLICLNFFRGEGYSKEYINNIYTVLKKEKAEIVEGPDDVCIVCPYLKDNKCGNSEYTNENIIMQDKEALFLLEFKPGMVVDWKTIAEKMPHILDKWKLRFCNDCGYQKVCFG
ncbi:MAG: DUF1284 domain-containing protein, partial [Candidatus Methanoperedens sp.]|nr:DUF1284 domain-containing protein [Candidatus Methanoperedens sp.]